MPAIRGCYLTHPTTGADGIWVELSTSAPGTLTGLARSAFPSVAGLTTAQAGTTLSAALQSLCNLPGITDDGRALPTGWIRSGGQLIPMIVQVVVTVTQVSPLVYTATINEGAIRQVQV